MNVLKDIEMFEEFKKVIDSLSIVIGIVKFIAIAYLLIKASLLITK